MSGMKRAPADAVAPSSDLKALLTGVSRSFGLSLALLPRALRPTLGLAYLLARASDTLADALPPLQTGHDEALWNDLLADRMAALEALGRFLGPPSDGEQDLAGFSQQWQQALGPRLEYVSKAQERTLLATLPHCLSLWQGLPPGDRAATGVWMGHILQGQQDDLRRLCARLPGHLACLSDESELQRYTWCVAGSVGQFWTRLCETHLQDWRRLPLDDMLALGQRYGQGLQRLNILRDTAEDLRDGRCYWPRADLAALGLSPEVLAQAVSQGDLQALSPLTPLWQTWKAQILDELQAGLRYALALRPLRLRLASALPALLGLRTLEAIESRGLLALCQPVRITRRQVYAVLAPLVLSLGHPGVMLRLAGSGSRGNARIAP